MTALLVALGSLVGVFVLVGLAWRLRLGGDPRLNLEEAHELIVAHGLVVEQLILDRAGAAALASDADGRFVLVRQHGARFLVVDLARPLEARLDHRFLTIGRGKRAVTLDLGDDAATWAASLRRLRP